MVMHKQFTGRRTNLIPTRLLHTLLHYPTCPLAVFKVVISLGIIPHPSSLLFHHLGYTALFMSSPQPCPKAVKLLRFMQKYKGGQRVIRGSLRRDQVLLT
jgi:hypothetical protein